MLKAQKFVDGEEFDKGLIAAANEARSFELDRMIEQRKNIELRCSSRLEECCGSG